MPQAFWAVLGPRERAAARAHAPSRRGRGRDRATGARRCATAASRSTSPSSAAGEPIEVVEPPRRLVHLDAQAARSRARGRVGSTARRAVDGAAGWSTTPPATTHAHTAWHWSAGVGTDGRRARGRWNLVDGVHDAPARSERTVWVDGVAARGRAGRVRRDLARLDSPTAASCASPPRPSARAATTCMLFASDYRQPFGTFCGTLPGGVELAEGCGVMERHDVRW